MFSRITTKTSMEIQTQTPTSSRSTSCIVSRSQSPNIARKQVWKERSKVEASSRFCPNRNTTFTARGGEFFTFQIGLFANNVNASEISVDFDNVFNGAFGGDGSGDGFAINQVADIVDNDSLWDVQQNNSGGFEMSANGGIAAQVAWDDVDDPFDGTTVADASAQLQGTAFNLDIVLGSNLQQNAVDVSIVGGSADNNDTTTTSGDSF